MSDLLLRCRCGSVEGVVCEASAAQSNRVVCGCKFCQAYAHHLGVADALLDEHGGTEVIQVAPARITFTRGFPSEVACLRLTRKGAVRWYATCCNTPLANTLATDRLPFVGLLRAALHPGPRGEAVDAVLGPVRARVNADLPEDRARWATLRMLAHYAFLLAAWRLRGLGRPSPFFDPKRGAPIHAPEMIDREARARAFDAVATRLGTSAFV